MKFQSKFLPLATQWKALSEEQQDAVQPQRVAKILDFAWREAGGKMDKDHEKRAGDLLGGYTTETQATMTFAEDLTGLGKRTFTVNGVETEIDLKNGGWNSPKWDYVNDYTYTDRSSSTTVTITVAQQKAVYDTLKAEYDAATPRRKALADFMSAQPNYTQFAASSRINLTHKFMLHYLAQAKANLGTYTPEQLEEYFMKNFGFCTDPVWNLKDAVQFHLNFRNDAYAPFTAIENPTEAQDNTYVAAYEKYNQKAADTTSIFCAVRSTYVQAFVHNDKLIGLGTIYSDFKKANETILGRRKGYEFNKKLELINIPAKGSPEFNKTIEALHVEYKALGFYGQKVVAPKYFDVIGKWYNDGTSAKENTHVLPEQVKVESEAPDMINNILQGSLESVINMAAGGLEGMISGMFTNDLMNASFLSSIDTALGSQMASLKCSPDTLASLLNTDELQFAKAKAELTGKTDWADVGYLDWGVIPGDYETFSKALCAALRGVLDNSTLGIGGIKRVFLDTFTIKADGSVNTATYRFGLYGSVIIPVMEMCGVTDMISSFEYTQKVEKMTAGNGHNDGYLKVMLDEIYYKLLGKILENPAQFIIKSLPNLVYHLEDGCIFKDVESSIRNAMGLLADPIMGLINPYMGLEKIWNLLTQPGIAADGSVTAPMLDLETLGINLTLEDITNIAHMGKAEIVDTECKKYQSRVNIIADEQSIKNYIVNLAMGITSDLGISFTTDAKFVRVEVPTYPHNGKMDKKSINALISGLETTISGFVNIEDAINGAIATNEMAGTAIKGIYDAINGIVSEIGIQPIGTDRVAEMFGDAKEFAGIVAELEDSDTWADVAFTIKNDNGEVIKQIDMGFKNGDFDGFIKTVVASLRPLVDELQRTSILTNSTANGETVYGLYETLIIPAFEALGLKPVATSATFTENFNKLHAKDENAGLDYLVNTITKPVISLLDRVKANPLTTIMDVLPNIAYALKYNPTTAFVGNLLLGDKNLADVLNGFVDGVLPGLKLNPINLDALISCGEIKEVDSMSELNKTYTTVVADKADTFVTAFYYLFDTINTGENLQLIKDLLADIEMDAGLKSVVDGLVISLFDMTREEALCTLGATFADWTCPDAEEENNANGGNGTNGKTPGTGDTAISAIAVVSVLFAAGVAIVLLRKKKTIAE